VCVGSCTNSSVADLETVAAILRGKTVHPDVSLTVSPGSKQALTMIARSGALADLVAAGARILESACGPCLGMGQAPASGALSVRSFNRNFKGRSGTPDAQVYLAGAEVCAATALMGALTDPRTLGEPPAIAATEHYLVDDNMIVWPPEDGGDVEVVRGPNIKPLPSREALEDTIVAPALLVMGDNVTTDDIMPAGAEILPFRSNVPALSAFVLTRLDPTFPERAKAAGRGILVAGENYGQGSSREHAALGPMYLGIQAVVAKSLARIHRANLINFGIAPLTFEDPADYGSIAQGDELRLAGAREAIAQGQPLTLENLISGATITVRCALSERERQVLLAGGLLNAIRVAG